MSRIAVGSVVLRITVRLAGLLTLLAMLALPTSSHAAELVMFWRVGCPYCDRFDREIGPIYGRSDEGKIAPLRRVDIHKPIPSDLDFVAMEPITPVFVLVDHGREIGRIRG